MGGAGAVLAAELCAPLLLLCWLCCWPDDARSDTSSSAKPPRKPVLVNESKPRRRSSELFGKRFGSSAISLHLPSTSGHKKQPLSAHRSHEEIRSRHKSHLEIDTDDARYHSAPSVIDEVLHRRDWERSSKELHIPLKSPGDEYVSDVSENSEIKAPHATPETTSPEEKDDTVNRLCKKHFTNIKSSKSKRSDLIVKETNRDDVKDQDVTENFSNFYIGEVTDDNCLHTATDDDLENRVITDDEAIVFGNNESQSTLMRKNSKYEDKADAIVCRAKEAKQSFNESVRSKEHPKHSSGSPNECQTYRVFQLGVDEVDQMDRSGAMHHTIESMSSLTASRFVPFPPPSVEPVGYEGGACYLAEAGCMAELRRTRAMPPALGVPPAAPPTVPPTVPPHCDAPPAGPLAPRPRHASDGDILAPAPRPESGAFSESEVELELSLSERDERPPPYGELAAPRAARETAI